MDFVQIQLKNQTDSVGRSKHQISTRKNDSFFKISIFLFLFLFHFVFPQSPLFSEPLYGNFLIFFPIIIYGRRKWSQFLQFSATSFLPIQFRKFQTLFSPNKTHKAILASIQFLLLRFVFHYLVNTDHLYI